MDLISHVQDSFIDKKEFPDFQAGDQITVYYKIREGEKTRTQFFQGHRHPTLWRWFDRDFHHPQNIRQRWC